MWKAPFQKRNEFFSNIRKFLSVRCCCRLMSMLYVISFCAQQPKLNTLYDHRIRKCRLYTMLCPLSNHPSTKIFAIGKFFTFDSPLLSLVFSLCFSPYKFFQKSWSACYVCELCVESRSEKFTFLSKLNNWIFFLIRVKKTICMCVYIKNNI